MNFIWTLWGEFRKPSERNPDPHHRGATGVWHSALGAMPVLAAEKFGAIAMALTAIALLIVYVWKEIGDINRGGFWRDSIEDVIFVLIGVGAAYYDALYGITVVNGLAVFVMWKQLESEGKE